MPEAQHQAILKLIDEALAKTEMSKQHRAKLLSKINFNAMRRPGIKQLLAPADHIMNLIAEWAAITTITTEEK